MTIELDMPAERVGAASESGAGAPTGRGRLLERRTSADAHSPGAGAVVFSPDGGNILTAGVDGLVKLFSTGLVRGGKGPAAFLRSISDIHNMPITSLAVYGSKNVLVTGCDDQHVRLFDLDALSQRSVLCRTTLGIPYLAFSPDGAWIAIAGEDGDVRLVNVTDISRSVTLEGHTNAVKCVAFRPDGKMLISSSADATIRIWQLHLNKSTDDADQPTDSAECVKIIRDVIERVMPNSMDKCSMDWHPSGSHFAACGRRNEVVMIQSETWTVSEHLDMPETPSIVKFSPNGIYLLTVGTLGHVRVWQPAASVSSGRLLVASASHHTVITSACWHPKANDMAFLDSEGVLNYVEKVVPSDLPHPVTGREKLVIKDKSRESRKNVNGSSSADMHRGIASLFDDAADEDNAVRDDGHMRKPSHKPRGAGSRAQSDDDEGDDVNLEGEEDEEEDDGDDDMDGFVVDDDGAGYVDDLKRPDAIRRYHERSRESALRHLDRNVRRTTGDSKIGTTSLFDSSLNHDIQAPFQPGSTPARGNKRYLAFNLLGAVWTIDAQTHSTVEVEFHDRSIRSFHFTDHYNYTMAALSEHGAVFACEASSTAPSTVFFRPLDSWASKGDWTLHLASGESVKAIAVTKAGAAVATDMNYLRFFSPGGVQVHVRSLSGPILSMSGHGRYLFVVHHAGGVFHGDQNLGFFVLDVETRRTVACHHLPLSPASTLEWIGFSQSGIPTTYDSTGVLRGLFLHEPDAPWVPILDTRSYRVEHKDHHYWAVGVTGNQFMCVICKGDKYPQFPKPIVNDLPLRIPLAQPDAPSTSIEEEWIRKSLGLLHRDVGINMDTKSTGPSSSIFATPEDRDREHTAQDKLVLQLIQSACAAEKPQRALDLCAMLHRLRSLEGAIKLAVHMRLPALAERMNSLKEARYLREKQELQERQRGELQARMPPYQSSQAWRQPVSYGDHRHAMDMGRDDMFDGADSVDFDAPNPHRNASAVHVNNARHVDMNVDRDQANKRASHARRDHVVDLSVSNNNESVKPNLPPVKKPRNPFVIRDANPDGSSDTRTTGTKHASTGGHANVDGSKVFDAIAKAAAAHRDKDASKQGRKTATDSHAVGSMVGQASNNNAAKRKQMTLFGLIPQKPDAAGDGSVANATSVELVDDVSDDAEMQVDAHDKNDNPTKRMRTDEPETDMNSIRISADEDEQDA